MQQAKIKQLKPKQVQKPAVKPQKQLNLRFRRVHQRRLFVLTVCLFGICGFGGWSLHQNDVAQASASRNMQQAQQQLTAAKAKKTALKVQADQLKNSDYLGKLVREKYLVSKPGELIFTLPSTASNATNNANNNSK